MVCLMLQKIVFYVNNLCYWRSKVKNIPKNPTIYQNIFDKREALWVSKFMDFEREQ